MKTGEEYLPDLTPLSEYTNNLSLITERQHFTLFQILCSATNSAWAPQQPKLSKMKNIYIYILLLDWLTN